MKTNQIEEIISLYNENNCLDDISKKTGVSTQRLEDVIDTYDYMNLRVYNLKDVCETQSVRKDIEISELISPFKDDKEKHGIGKSVVYGLTEEKIIDIISMHEKGYTSQQIERETICGLSDVEAVIKAFNVINRNTQATKEIYVCENETLKLTNESLVKELNELYRKIALKLLEK